tara:strand:- start:363 stop:560 length:198 start_codon:yes stop_codon:yes gene_type:complete
MVEHDIEHVEWEVPTHNRPGGLALVSRVKQVQRPSLDPQGANVEVDELDEVGWKQRFEWVLHEVL